MKRNNNIIRYIPVILFFVLHIIGSCSVISQVIYPGAIVGAVVISFLAFIWGEGYGIIAFMIASKKKKIWIYILTIVMCIISSVACVIGYFITAIESAGCRWMTVCLIILNVLVVIESIREMILKLIIGKEI